MATRIRAAERQANLPIHGAEAPIKAEGFNHLHINVRDLSRSIRFYREAFGLKVGFSAGKDLIFMVPEGKGHSLALHQVGPDEPVGMAGAIPAFRVQAGRKRSRSGGQKQVERGGGKLVSRGKHGGQYPYAYVADPDGYIIEL